MAEIRPFRGVHHDWTQLDDPAAVVAPPYDVIDDAEQAALYARHPHNVVRLILNRKPAEGADNRYDDAAATMRQWRDEGVMVRDEAPALYVCHQRFELPNGAWVTRRGFMASVRLHDYDERVILPHEQTLRGPKVDRLRLNETVGANLSQVFLLYDDPKQRADALLEAACEDGVPLVIKTDDGIVHRLWTVTDEAVISEVRQVLINQQLLIADGHHRYETNLALRDRAIERGETLADDDPRRFVLAYLANGADPGLVVLPTHRVVHSLEGFDAGGLLARLEEAFEVRPFEGDEAVLDQAVRSHMESQFAFGLVIPGDPVRRYLLLRERDEAPLVTDLEAPVAVRGLDLTVLHEVIFKRMLGMSEEDFSNKRYLRYEKGLAGVEAALAEGEAQAIFLVNPSPVSQVREVCLSGGKMPQKSTFFYPKVLSGLVVRLLTED